MRALQMIITYRPSLWQNMVTEIGQDIRDLLHNLLSEKYATAQVFTQSKKVEQSITNIFDYLVRSAPDGDKTDELAHLLFSLLMNDEGFDDHYNRLQNDLGQQSTIGTKYYHSVAVFCKSVASAAESAYKIIGSVLAQRYTEIKSGLSKCYLATGRHIARLCKIILQGIDNICNIPRVIVKLFAQVKDASTEVPTSNLNPVSGDNFRPASNKTNARGSVSYQAVMRRVMHSVFQVFSR